MTLNEFPAFIAKSGAKVFHYEAQQNAYPYIVWQETSTTFINASNEQYTRNVNISLSHFTKTEFDPTLEKLEALLRENKLFYSIVTSFDRVDKAIQNQIEINISHVYEVFNYG